MTRVKTKDDPGGTPQMVSLVPNFSAGKPRRSKPLERAWKVATCDRRRRSKGAAQRWFSQQAGNFDWVFFKGSSFPVGQS